MPAPKSYQLPLALTVLKVSAGVPAEVAYEIRDAAGTLLRSDYFQTAAHNIEEVCAYTVERATSALMSAASVGASPEVLAQIAAMRAPPPADPLDQVVSAPGIPKGRAKS